LLKNFFQILFIFCLIASLFSCQQNRPSDRQVTITGSSQLLSLAEALASDFRSQSGISITVKGSLGQEEELLLKRLTDLLITTESLKTSPQAAEFAEKIIAKDKIILVSNPDTGLRRLSDEQLKKIFFGQIKNWAQVGGNNKSIQIITREAGASIRKNFENTYLQKQASDQGELSFNALVVNSNQEMKSAIVNIQGSIGYLSIGALSPSIQEIEVYDDSIGQKLEMPLTTIYAIWLSSNTKSEMVKFVDYLIGSTAAHKVITEEGYTRED